MEDLDLLVTQTDGRARLLRDDAEKQGTWISVRLLDPKIKRDAYGARVVVSTEDGTYIREANPGFSYLTSNDPRVHIALPRGSRVTNFEVLWPDGFGEMVLVPALDRHVVLEKGAGKKLR